ncbi:MAG: CpsD/CapB family tyrosine-protein kinase [Clostridiales bacterium]|nr:CpsD/CapB family tyrosine-protein kinase [Clostridiales bacterium]
MNYIKRKHKTINQVRVFTNKAILYDFLLENKIDLLLISEDKLEDNIYHDNISKMCILSENNYIGEDHNRDIIIIYKFQSAKQIVGELLVNFPSLNVRANTHSSRCNIVSIFTLNNSYDKDRFSFNLARFYGVKERVLLVDLNLLHGNHHLSSLDKEKNLSEFLYFLKSESPNILLKMNLQIQRLENFDFLKGVMFGPDLYDVTSKDLNLWLQELEGSDYDTIIFNIGCFMVATLDLIRNSNRVFLVTSPSSWNKFLYENLVDQLKFTGYEDIIDKVARVDINKALTDIDDTSSVFSDKWGELVRVYARDV